MREFHAFNRMYFADILAIQKRPYETKTRLYPSRGRTENYLDLLEMSG